MTFGIPEITQLVEMIWATTLDWEIAPTEENVDAPPTTIHTGSVAITGDWTGSVTLHCHPDISTQAAARVFALPESEVSPDLVQDALGELTNILAGNLKGLLGGKCYLGLPTVVEGNDYAVHLPGSERVLRASFRCHDRPLIVDVHQRQT